MHLKSKWHYTIALIIIGLITSCRPITTHESSITPTPKPPTPIFTSTTQPVKTSTPAPTSTATILSTKTPTNTPSMVSTEGEPFVVDVGDYTLTIYCSGEGSPTVILESGWITGWEYWQKVISYIQPQTRVCAYNRSSKTEGKPNPQAVDDLHALLANAHLEGPFILVGHSLGGIYAILYTARYPEDVAGIVLLNSANPDQDKRILAEFPPESPDESSTMKQSRQELTNSLLLYEALSEEFNAIKSLGDVPLVVMTANGGRSRCGTTDPTLDEIITRVWLRLQAELTRLSTNSTQQTTANSCDSLPEDTPSLVAQEILKLVETARKN
jgi:pimeloyl-ACP methyl ester carboxylesterase